MLVDCRYIYLVFTRTGSWLSRLINVFSDTKYAHSSVSFDSNFTKMYSFGRIKPENPFWGGFVEENLHDGIYKKFSHCECLIYKVGVTEEQHLLLQEQIDIFISEKEKYRYNFIGLFGILFNIPIKRQKHYFCSQFVSEILIRSNIFYSEKAPELIRTNELYAIENKEIIYEGLVNESYQLVSNAICPQA